MADRVLTSIPFGRILGGGVFGAITGIIGCGMATPRVTGIFLGLCCGAFVGGMIAAEIHNLFRHDVRWPRIYRTPNNCRSTIVYGMTLTRNFTLFLLVPFAIACSTLLMVVQWKFVGNNVFWLEGICVHAIVLASIVSLLIEWPFYSIGARRQASISSEGEDQVAPNRL